MLIGTSNDPQAVQSRPADAVNDNPALPWYVCFTKPRQEQYAASKLREQGYEVYLPMLESWARQAGNWRKKQTVMFPRYGFVRPSSPVQAIGPARSTPGVSNLVRFGPALAYLREDRLEALRSLVAVQACAMPDEPFQAGASVVFCSGPLKGASGIVSSVAAERVQVLMDLLGQNHAVRVHSRDLALS